MPLEVPRQGSLVGAGVGVLGSGGTVAGVVETAIAARIAVCVCRCCDDSADPMIAF